MKTLVIGSTVLDMIVVVDELPQKEGDVHTRSISCALGGMAYNVQDVMVKMNASAILATPIGTGFFADSVEKLLRNEGKQSFAKIHEMDNGVCLCLIDKSGERTFISHHGAEYQFDAEWYKACLFDGIDFIYVSGLEVEEGTGEALVQFLEEKKKPIFFAPGPRLCLVDKNRMERLFRLHPILHLNKDEALHYTHKETLQEAAGALCEMTLSSVIITCGKDGVYLKEINKEGCWIQGESVEVVDTVGAGDSHAGAVLACLQKGLSLVEACRVGNQVAALVVGSQGAGIKKEQKVKLHEIMEKSYD